MALAGREGRARHAFARAMGRMGLVGLLALTGVAAAEETPAVPAGPVSILQLAPPVAAVPAPAPDPAPPASEVPPLPPILQAPPVSPTVEVAPAPVEAPATPQRRRSVDGDATVSSPGTAEPSTPPQRRRSVDGGAALGSPGTVAAFGATAPAVAAPQVAISGPAVVPAPSAETAANTAPSIRFGADLGLGEDINLQGVMAQRRVDLSIPGDLRLTGDAILHLEVSHSAALLAGRSHLTVIVNGSALASLALQPETQSGARFDVTVPQALLRDYNNIELAVAQHSTMECEDPADPALWTRVGRGSSLELRAERAPVVADLGAWPAPILDLRGHGPIAITPVLGAHPDAATAAAMGELGAGLGRLARYRTLAVSPAVGRVEEAEGVALVVGLAGDLPEALRLWPVPPALAPGEGLVGVAPNPADPTRPALVVVGADAAGLAKATRAALALDRQPLLSGPYTIVRGLNGGQSPSPAVKAFPAGPDATLAALGVTDQTVRGRYAPAIRVPLRLEGDAWLHPEGAVLDLRYGYGAQLDPRRATLEVRVDGVTVRSVALSEPDGVAEARLKVPLPTAILNPSSVLEVVFLLLPQAEGDCVGRAADETLWGTLYADSSLHIPREHQAAMPDLGRLRHGGWPYMATEALPVIIGLPSSPDPAAWAAGLSLAATLGQRSPAASPALRMVLATAALAEAPEQLILLGDADGNPAIGALSGRRLLPGGADRSLRDAGGAELARVHPGGAVDSLEQVLRGPGRSALVLEAGSAEGLTRLARALGDPSTLEALAGGAVVFQAEGGVRSLDLGPKETWGSLPPTVALGQTAREQWWLVGVVLALGAGLLVGLVRRLAGGAKT